MRSKAFDLIPVFCFAGLLLLGAAGAVFERATPLLVGSAAAIVSLFFLTAYLVET